MWKGSTKLGIGQATGKNNGMFCTYIVGRYKPAGNFQGKYDANVKKGSFEKSKVCDKLDDMIKNLDSIGDNGDSTGESENEGGANESVGGGSDNNQNGENSAGSSNQSSGGGAGGGSSEGGGGGVGGGQTGAGGDAGNSESGGGGEGSIPSDAGAGASTDSDSGGGGGSGGNGAPNIEQPELVIAREEALKAATEIGVKIGKEIAAKYKASQKDEILPSAKQALDLTMSSFNQRRLNMSTAAFLDSIKKQVRLQKKSPIVQYGYEKLKKSKILPQHHKRRSNILPIREKRSSMLTDGNATRKINPASDTAKNINAAKSKCSLTKRHHISKKPNTRTSLIEYEKYLHKYSNAFRNETVEGTKKSTMADIVALGAKLNAILASKSGTKKSNMQDIVKLGAKIGAIEGAKAGAIAGMCTVHACLFELCFLNSFCFFISILSKKHKKKYCPKMG